MKSEEAAKLLGGYATGTLSEAERQALFAAALERQELFDALMDEEALRELLADPGAKAQLMEALSQAAPPRVVPLWRRPSLLGAAAGLIVAATAGLTYLRSPEKAPPPLRESTQPAPAAAVSAGPQAPPPAARQNALPSRRKEAARPIALETAAPPPPAPQPLAAPSLAGAPVPAREEASRMNLQAESRRADAQDRVAQKAEAPKAAGAMMDAAGSTAPAARMRAKTAGAYRPEAAAPHIIAPAWTLALQPDGSTRVTIRAVRGQQVALLRRGAAGVEVLPLRAMNTGAEALVQWQGDVRLAAGDILDLYLYLLNTPLADPALLPETGPVDGYRVRIHPSSTK